MSKDQSPIQVETKNGIAHVALDDGKVNALSPSVVEELHSKLDELAETEDCKVVMLSGRPGVFCAGFDLKVIRGPSEEASALMNNGVDLFLKLFSYSKPVVAACTGHAVAAGAILLMCSDLRVGPDQPDIAIGLNEVSIGMEIPPFLIEIAGARLANERMHEALNLARLYSPADSINVGFLDQITAPEKVLDQAETEAKNILENLDLTAFQKTKRRLRKGPAERTDKARR